MSLIDCHVHIDYYEDFYEKFNYYHKHKIYTLFVTNLPDIYGKCIKSFDKSKYVKIALGYNPQFAGSEKFNKKIFDKYFVTTKYIGEVGLDYTNGLINYRDKQIETFEYIAFKSAKYNKILSIHSKNAENDVISILKNNKVRFAVFHWYSGRRENIKEIIDMGYYFSVNYNMLKSQKGLSIIKRVPLDRILIETDGPFTKYKGNIIIPEKLSEIYSEFAHILNVGDFKGLVFNNFKKLLLLQEESKKKI